MDRISAIENFISVAEKGSFSAAAKRLKVGQPAISKSIAQLEKKLSVRLLIRSTRGVTLTDAGQRFYTHAKLAIEKMQEAEQSVLESNNYLSGRLRISAAVTFARLHIIPVLKEFTSINPALNIDVMLDDRHIDLIGEGVDVALRMGTLSDSNMVARKIAQAPRLLIGTPKYFSNTGTPRTPEDLVKHQAIIYSQPGFGESWTFKKAGKEVSVVMSGQVTVSAAEGIRAAVLSDMGLVVASEWMFAEELAEKKVISVLSDWTLPPVNLWAIFPTGRLISTKAQKFVSFVEQVMADKGYVKHS